MGHTSRKACEQILKTGEGMGHSSLPCLELRDLNKQDRILHGFIGLQQSGNLTYEKRRAAYRKHAQMVGGLLSR